MSQSESKIMLDKYDHFMIKLFGISFDTVLEEINNDFAKIGLSNSNGIGNILPDLLKLINRSSNQ